MQKALVTGGNIGRYVAEGLAGKGVPVRVLVRRVELNRKWLDLQIEQVACDLGDVTSLAAAFDNADRFFCVTPLVENLVELGINAVEAAKRAGVRYIVRSSALGASEQASTMQRWHRAVEKVVEESGITNTILQPNTFMQGYLDAESIKRDGAFYMPIGDAKISLVDVRDIAAMAVACLTEAGHEGKKYAVTGGEALSNADVANKLTSVVDKQVTYVNVSLGQAKESLTKAGMPGWMVSAFLELFGAIGAGVASELSPAVEQVLKRKPISFDQFLTENAALFRNPASVQRASRSRIGA
jgi:uncharacterized protein YbjT (DUF2867 family)